MSDPNAYTVGWICAIHEEYIAARAFLDEIHDGPDFVSVSNINHYTLGKLGKHHVVMAVLPAGGYGTCSAASVARDLLHNFPNIRIGLMVGVGGGVPSQDHDIRLGDIVVSEPAHGTGGVLQLDFGKDIQDKDFQLTGCLTKPPVVLLTAVNGLKTRYGSDGHQLEHAISSVLQRKPRLQKRHSRPDPSADRLYKSSIVHPGQSMASCADVCNSDASALLLRPQRTEHDDNPMIHYGLIASSNRVVKNALTRDRLAAEKDILCIEMEAAGLMDHFPCLVIRGICDYSDSHKNKKWQGYAALAAAAYARDLLSEISPIQIEAQKRVSDILDGISTKVDRLVQARDDHRSRAIFEWLATKDYSSEQRDYLEERQKGTCEWLLGSNEFQSWLLRAGEALFCPGIPGAGKTIAASVVVDDLCRRFQGDKSVAIAFVFYSYQQRQATKAQLYSSLLGQLARPLIPKAVLQLYEAHTTRTTRPSPESVFETLNAAISEFSRVFIIVDALDEYSTSDSARLEIATELLRLQVASAANIFVTARNLSWITEKFKNGGSTTIVEIRPPDEDIERYVKSHIPDLPPFDTPGLKQKILTAIVRATDGMFLLARLYLKSLENMYSVMEIDEFLEKLPKGSDSYSEAYNEAMRRIKGQQAGSCDLAIRVLSWIARSRRPLKISELRHALAVIPNSSKLNSRNLIDPGRIVDACGGLVTLEKESGIIRLVHYTTQEYFERSWMTWFPGANRHIATVCLTYLAFEEFCAGPADSWKKYRKRLQGNHLYGYAARHWGYYASESYAEVKDLTATFLRNDTALASAAQVLVEQTTPFGPFMIQEGITGLHIAAYYGLNGEVMDFLRDPIANTVADGHGQTPLHWAARNCQIKAVEFLLHKGLDVNATDKEMKSALHYAASQDNRALIQLLLQSGARIEAGDICDQTPLLVAADAMGAEAVKELLSQGARINALDIKNRNALHLAIISTKAKSPLLVGLLLSQGIDFNLCDVENMTPMHYAVGTGSRQTIDLLLEAGDDINFGIERKLRSKPAESGRPRYHYKKFRMQTAAKREKENLVGLTPLHFAVCMGYKAMVEYLLSRGANPNARCQDGDTPLHIALRRCLLKTQKQHHIFHGGDGWTDNRWKVELAVDCISDHESEEAQDIYQFIEEERLAVVSTLLASTSIDVNIPNIELDCPIHIVAYGKGNAGRIVHKLLELGADIFACNSKGQTALHMACKAGASDIACDFLDRGCCVETMDQQGLNALHYAVRANQYGTVITILKRDRQIFRYLCRGVDACGRALMHHHLDDDACSLEMIIVLLFYGARLNNIDQGGNTPLSLYLGSFQWVDRTEICRFLLQHGADAHWRSPNGQNLAHLAMCSYRGEVGVLEALRDHDVDLTAKDDSGETILHHGAIHGTLNEEVLSFVQGSNLFRLDDKDNEGKTPLLYASEAANETRSPDSLARHRWNSSLGYLKRLHEFGEMTVVA
ncbi:ankyrin repeat-containing domain protein [Aspergillus varians]